MLSKLKEKYESKVYCENIGCIDKIDSIEPISAENTTLEKLYGDIVISCDASVYSFTPKVNEYVTMKLKKKISHSLYFEENNCKCLISFQNGHDDALSSYNVGDEVSFFFETCAFKGMLSIV